MKVAQIGSYLYWWCSGCKTDHRVPIDSVWTFNGSFDNPTLSPSCRHFYQFPDEAQVTTCHYFIREGRIEYCSDCQHELSGQILNLEEVEVFGDSVKIKEKI